MNLTPEQRVARFKAIVKIVAVGLIGLVGAYIAATIIYGLIGLIIAAFIGYGSILFAPVVADKLGNWKLKMIKAEASKNPVETLQREYMLRSQELEAKRDSNKRFTGKVGMLADKIKAYRRKHPASTIANDPDLADNVERHDKLQNFLQMRLKKFAETEQALQEFLDVIDKAGDTWEMAKIAAEADAMIGTPEEEFTRRIKVNTSLDAISEKMNMSFAELDNLVTASKQIPVDPGAAQLESPSSSNQVVTSTQVRPSAVVRK